MLYKIRFGKFGEQIAIKYLGNQGYKVLVKNYYTREGEIDLICQKNKVIHFVEVKTRTTKTFGWPEEAVTKKKIEKINLAVQKYLSENEINLDWQIDVVSIIIVKKGKNAQIKHFKNIVQT